MKYFLPLMKKPEIDNRPQLQIPLAPPDWYIIQIQNENSSPHSDADPSSETPPRGVVIIEL